jgi:hypothetical protein
MGSTQGNIVNRFDGDFDLDEPEDQCFFDGGLLPRNGFDPGKRCESLQQNFRPERA